MKSSRGYIKPLLYPETLLRFLFRPDRYLRPLLIGCMLAGTVPLQAQPADSSSSGREIGGIRHTSEGFELTGGDGNYALQIQLRAQFRLSLPADLDPANLTPRGDNDQYYFGMNRARLKAGGHAFRPWLKYYGEFELASSSLLDFGISVEKYPWLKVKVGQWRVPFNRESIISSAEQQTIDRSLMHRFFTADRQEGISLYGRMNDGGLADFSYWFSVYNGAGRGGGINRLGNAMYVGRLQWNFMGEPVPFTGSDLEGRENFNGGLTIAGLLNRSAYTRFSQTGGGRLEGFSLGTDDRYGLRQLLIESAFMYRGLTWQQELHYKRIRDFTNNSTTDLLGNYFQAGYFFHRLLDWVPEPLEIAVRYSIVNPDRDRQDDLLNEFAFAANWFFNRHNNKLTAEINVLHFQPSYTGLYDGTRFRLQWDISF